MQTDERSHLLKERRRAVIIMPPSPQRSQSTRTRTGRVLDIPAIDDGAAYTGPNTRLTVMSRGGLFLVANATDLNDQNHGFGEMVP
jgi:hypothetical protein